jgi:hypothetical protein
MRLWVACGLWLVMLDGMENEMEGQLAGLESERAVWSRRRQGGSLDVTPPGVGRFERFLH